MSLGALGGFWVVSVLLALTPGADWAFAIAAGLRGRAVLPAVLGMVGGYVALTALVAAGVAAVLASEPSAIRAIGLAGAAYLLWLGVGALIGPSAVVRADGALPRTPSRTALQGFGVSGLNPKALLLFVVLLPQFTDPASGWPIELQLLALGAVHTATCGLVLSVVGVGARSVLRARPAAAAALGRLTGVVMAALGVALLAEQVAQGV